MPKQSTQSVITQLRTVFTVSTALLVISLIASFYSIQNLISSSKQVNHTNEVLIEAENIISFMKDAETGQRGFLVTLDPTFLQPFNGAYQKTQISFRRISELTLDNPTQQRNLAEVERLYEAKFVQMQRVIDLAKRTGEYSVPILERNAEMRKGKVIMDSLRTVINHIKAEETHRLRTREAAQQTYITYTPFLLLLAALISILITAFAYFRIKRDLDERLVQQLAAEARYRETTERIRQMEDTAGHLANGEYAVRVTDSRDDELGRIARAINHLAESLEHTFTDLANVDWIKTGSVHISDAIRGQRNAMTLGEQLITAIAEYLRAPLGTLYLLDIDDRYKLAGQYAVRQAPPVVYAGQGLIGQAIAQQNVLVIDTLPPDYTNRISSSLGETIPTALVLVPLLHEGQCLGVLELGLLRTPDAHALELLNTNREAMAIGINAALDYVRLQHLLEETQAQSEELQSQHSELENLNTELEMQAQRLQASEEELRVQQEELQQTNAELEERGLLLEEKNDEIQKKADELELSTRYKSEFLANLSHELRTPLNSILLLSRLLAENNEANLTTDQVEYATVIQASGNGLLGLIDEILDLSKIEAGQMTLEYLSVSIQEITAELQGLFGLMAKEKGLDFVIDVQPDVPATLETDKVRLGQVLKNLISNALKFTVSGSITLTISRQTIPTDMLRFSVKDTGIGIPADKQALVFEAFQQADGSTKRKYGGTGLGLSISRELARILGGEISLVSQVGQGSEFTVHLPVTASPAGQPQPTPTPAPPVVPVAQAPAPAPAIRDKYISPVIPDAIPDDRDTIGANDRTILIVEDDAHFAKALLDYARKKGYKGLVAVRGDEGLRLAEHFRPTGILLDVQLPVMSGWEVMDALKANPKTRPIPVHIMSSLKLKNESMLKGAIDFVDKPMAFEQMQDVFKKIEYVLNRDTKKVLIIEDNPRHAKALAYFLESFNINSELRSDMSEGLDALKREEVDCVILDMGVPDAKAYAILEEAKKNPGLENLPIIIFTGKSLSMSEEMKIKKYADSIIVKTAHSYQRMLDEVSLFLHLVEENRQQPLTPDAPRKLGELSQVLANKTVLVADDDVRNIFSLSKALEQYDMTIIAALDGKEAMQKLHENPAIDVVLLDMMMPQMDGYETARKIREQPRFRQLPVIAVTAKAMTGDREKCIQAGASDYITKPVDIDQLISLLRVWLYDRA